VVRLQAASVALERRYSQLDASKDRRSGILAPFAPSEETPWREGLKEGGVELDEGQTDPSADMSSQWEQEQEQAQAGGVEAEMQRELVRHLQTTLPPSLRSTIMTLICCSSSIHPPGPNADDD